MKWNVLSTRQLFKDLWFSVRADKCETPSGKIIEPYYVYEFPEWVTALAITNEGRVIMERQYRHGLGEVSIELPGGCVDDTDNDYEAAVRRELLEETGYTFKEAVYLGKTSANPSTNSNLMHMYLLTEGVLVQEQKLDAGEELEVFTITIEDLKQLVRENKIVQSMHLTTILYGLRYLGKLTI